MKIADCRLPIAGRLLLVVSALAALALAAGCSSPQMKGTPFYTGEYERRVGPAEDRVNAWPLLYYREPALSVIWPLGEVTDDYFAIRPVLSVYGLGTDKKEYNFLWPLTHFDQRTGDNRIFPAFWGKEYACVFPLYWHEGRPYSGKPGYDTLLPLWWFSRDSGGYSTWILGPLAHVTEKGDRSGWHVFPLAGRYSDGGDLYRFVAWPLFHQWSEDHGNAGGSALIPLYGYNRNPGDSWFISLPYGSRRAANGDEWRMITPLYFDGSSAREADSWQLLVPLYYSRRSPESMSRQSLLGGYRRQDEERSWWALPLLGWGRADKDSGDFWLLGPLAHSAWGPRSSSQHVVPLYYRSSSDEGSRFFSLPWSHSVDRAGNGWSLVPPLYFGSRSAKGESLITPIYAQSRAADGKSAWQALVPIYYRSSSDERSRFFSLPWSSSEDSAGNGWSLVPPVYFGRRSAKGESLITPLYAQGRAADGKSAWQSLIPIYYRQRSEDESLLVTLLGGYRADAAGDRWLIYPLLSGGGRDEHGRSLWVAAPLFHWQTHDGVASHHLLPLYYWDGQAHTLISPLAAQWTTAKGGNSFLVPPALTYWSEDPKRWDVWAAAGLLHLSGGEEGGPQHLAPLFYRNPRTETFISPVYAGWRKDGGSASLVPPALTYWSDDPKRWDVWAAAGLLHLSGGEEGGPQHLVPLFYRNPRTRTFLSPAYAGWKSDGKDYGVCPPLLSMYSTDGREHEIYGALGLLNAQWGAGEREGHLIPLYLYRGSKEVYTPLFGWNRRTDAGFFYPLTPLLGVRTGERYSGGWLFPLASHRRDLRSDDVKETFLWGGYDRRGKTSSSGLWPLFGYHNYGPAPTGAVSPAQQRYSTYGKKFWSLPACWYENSVRVRPDYGGLLAGSTATNGSVRAAPALKTPTNSVTELVRKNGFFPLWSYKRSEQPGRNTLDVDASCLLLLYDYLHEVKPEPDSQARSNDYTRSRVLWRLWHYERSNGDVSVDIIPAITYDHKVDGYRQVSFLWRAFRYQRGADGTKVDLLFVPVWRGGRGEKTAAGTVAAERDPSPGGGSERSL